MGFRDFIRSRKRGGRQPAIVAGLDRTVATSPGDSTTAPTHEAEVVALEFSGNLTDLSSEDLVSHWRLDLNNSHWPPPDPRTSNSTISHSGQLMVNFEDHQLWHWAIERRQEFAGESRRLFPPTYHVSGTRNSTNIVDFQDYSKTPPLLLDLRTLKVVTSSSIPKPWTFAFLSYVWGEVSTEIDGARFNLKHNILVHDARKLDLLLEYAKIVTGERYIWLDILCHSTSSPAEDIPRMHDYLSSASGCLVWLDDTGLAPSQWSQVLRAIEYINGACGLDKASRPRSKKTLSEFLADSELLRGSASTHYLTMLHVLNLEQAQWFQRLWTLQEGVVPDNVYLVTPERYMLSGWTLMHTIKRMSILAATVFAELDEKCWSVMLSQSLAQSEVWKIAQLRESLRTSVSSPEKARVYIPLLHVLRATRTRRGRVEQDVCFGTAALHPVGLVMAFSYDYSAKSLLAGTYISHLKSGDFSTLLWLGPAANVCSPDLTMIGPVVIQPTTQGLGHSGAPITQLMPARDSILLRQAGVTEIAGWQYVYSKNALPFAQSGEPHLDMPLEIQQQVARAFGMDEQWTTMGNIGQSIGRTYPPDAAAARICPSFWAITEFINIAREETLTGDAMAETFGNSCQVMQAEHMAKGWVMFQYALQLLHQNADYGIIAVWDTVNGPQLAIVSKPISTRAALLTSVETGPGGTDGGLICIVEDDGSLTKLGVSLGRELRPEKVVERILLR